MSSKTNEMSTPSFQNIVRSLCSCYEENEARAIARYVLDVRFGITQTDICMGKDKQIPAEEGQPLENIIARLLKKEPVQYVLGEADFCGRTFHVSPRVLIPRPETEELVQWILEGHATKVPLQVLDIGTGSGCIAITLDKDLPSSEVTAIDISPQALDIARQNAEKHHAHVSFVLQDILQDDLSPELCGNWDIIVSNPPYICQSEQTDMEENVLRYEPWQALFVPDAQPLLFYEAIGRFASRRLKPQGRLYVEINRNYGQETMEIFRQSGLQDIELRKDLCGNDRLIMCKK